MRSILVLLILVMIGLNGKGQSVTALPDSVLSQCCLEVTLLNGNVTTVDWVFIQYITRDGTGTKLFVEYAPNFGGIQWETQIRIQDDFDGVIERSKFIMLPFTVGSTDYAIHRNWIANIEENTTTGGTWVYGRFGTPTKRKFSAVEDYEYLKNLLLLCRPRAIVVAENGLYTEGDTVRMGGFLIEPTTITTEGYNWQMKDTLSSVEFGLDYLTPETGDTTVYWGRRSGSVRQMAQLGRRYYYNSMRDTTGGLYSDLTHSWNAGDPFLQYQIFNPLAPNSGTAWFKVQKDNAFLVMSNETTNPYYTSSFSMTNSNVQIGMNESGSGDPGNGVGMGAYGFGTTEYLYMITKGVDNNTATTGQFLQLINETSGEVDFATIDLSEYLPIADTAAMLSKYIERGDTNSMLTNYVTFGNLSGYPTGTGTADRLARWTGTNTLAAGNLSDNGTRLQALLPWQFHSWTTAGRPTGVNNYWGYNSTIPGLDHYNGSAWSTLLFGAAANRTYTLPDATGTFGLLERTQSWTGTNTFQANGTNGAVNWSAANTSYASTLTLQTRVNTPYTGGFWGLYYGNAGGYSFDISGGANVIYANGAIIAHAGQGSSGGQNMYLRGGLAGSISNNAWNTFTSSTTITNPAVTTGNIRSFSIQPTVNLTQPNSIVITGLYYSPTLTATNGASHRFVESVSGDWYVGSTSGVMGIRTAPDAAYELKLNGDLFVQDSTRLTATPVHSAITGLLTRDANGWVGQIERKRDTTIYIDNADFDFSAAITTAQIASRFNRVIFLMTTTAAAGSDSELTLHTPDANLMQVEYLIRSTDEAGGFDNKIVFGTNNAVSSTNTLATNYFPAAGQGVGVRIGLRSGVYKYYYY